MSTRKYFGTDGIRGQVGEWPISADFMGIYLSRNGAPQTTQADLGVMSGLAKKPAPAQNAQPAAPAGSDVPQAPAKNNSDVPAAGAPAKSDVPAPAGSTK